MGKPDNSHSSGGRDESLTTASLMQLIILILICTIVIFLNGLVAREISKDIPSVRMRHKLYTVILTACDVLVASFYLLFSLLNLLENGGIVNGNPLDLCSNICFINAVSLFSSVLGLTYAIWGLSPILHGGEEYENWMIARKFLSVVSWSLVASVLYMHVKIGNRKWQVTC